MFWNILLIEKRFFMFEIINESNKEIDDLDFIDACTITYDEVLEMNLGGDSTMEDERILNFQYGADSFLFPYGERIKASAYAVALQTWGN